MNHLWYTWFSEDPSPHHQNIHKIHHNKFKLGNRSVSLTYQNIQIEKPLCFYKFENLSKYSNWKATASLQIRKLIKILPQNLSKYSNWKATVLLIFLPELIQRNSLGEHLNLWVCLLFWHARKLLHLYPIDLLHHRWEIRCMFHRVWSVHYCWTRWNVGRFLCDVFP